MNTLPRDITSIIAGFSDWVDAVYTGNTELALFLHETFHMNVHQLLRDDYHPRFHKYNEPKEDTYRYPLEIAVIAGNKTLVQSLLQSGANPNVYNQKENRPILFQAYFKSFDPDHELMSLLLQYQADINATLRGKTLLLYAIERDDTDAVRFYVENGIRDLSVIHGNMYESSHTDILTLLLDHGLSPNSCHNTHGPLLHEAIHTYKKHMFHTDTRFIQLLLERGADPFVMYKNESPLALLSRSNDFYSYDDALCVLFSYGVNPEKDTTIKDEYRDMLRQLYTFHHY
jgi:ankyrin repeat protein